MANRKRYMLFTFFIVSTQLFNSCSERPVATGGTIRVSSFARELLTTPDTIPKTNKFTLYATPGEECRLSLDAGLLSVVALPRAPAVEYLQVEIDDTSYLRVPVKNGAVLVELPRLDDGIHKIRMTAEQRRRPNDRELSFRKLSHGLYLIVEGAKWSFAASSVYEANRSLFPTASKPSDYLNPDKAIHSKHAAIINLARRITRNCRSDYEMARAVHDWVARNIYYDYDALASTPNSYPKGAMDVLMSSKTLCGGFANLSAALLRSLGIPCRAVAGYGANDGVWTNENINADPNHAWNEVYIEGRWMIMDVAWDCEMSFRNGVHERGTGLRDRRYFDPSLESFSIDHRIYDADLNAIRY